jgi:hypothetical protein
VGPEKDKVRLHPVESQKLLDHIEDMDPTIRKWIAEVIGQEMALKNGAVAAIPAGKSADIPTMARILGLCDYYEAMTHPRSWRKGISPHEMIKNFLKNRRQEVDSLLIRNFVGALSLFPPGCLVQLSTQESAYVVLIHSDMPTRPTVEIRVRSDGTACSPPKLINLIENPTTHIVAAIDESQAGIKDPVLLKQLESDRWWIE